MKNLIHKALKNRDIKAMLLLSELACRLDMTIDHEGYMFTTSVENEEILNNYNMGFITSLEFAIQCKGVYTLYKSVN